MNMILLYYEYDIVLYTNWLAYSHRYAFKGIRCTFAVATYFSISLLQPPLLLLVAVVGLVVAVSMVAPSYKQTIGIQQKVWLSG